MLSRASVEAVLRKHNVSVYTEIGNMASTSSILNELIDDLLALAPTPSREALLAIVKRHPGCLILETLSACIEEIMTWAQGQPTPPVWCEHIEWKNGHWCYSPTDFTGGLTGTFPLATLWKFCPLCSTPRPGVAA